MGAPETLRDFLRFCEKNYPADHKVLILVHRGAAGALLPDAAAALWAGGVTISLSNFAQFGLQFRPNWLFFIRADRNLILINRICT